VYSPRMERASAARRIGAGPLLRQWRAQRGLSQLDLAVDAGISARHLSFLETGRARPSREMVLLLARTLDMPLRDRNALLVAAGYAPVYRETPLDAEAMSPVRDALDQILAGHAPFPAVIVDQRWDLVSANEPALAIMSEGVDPELLRPPVNTLRLCCHPGGLAPRIANLAEYSAHLVTRALRQAALGGDQVMAALADELRAYPGVGEPATTPEPVDLLFVPFRLTAGPGPGRAGGPELSFFSTLTTFGTAVDITLAELSIEAFFPADEETAAYLRGN
jgi:transcriptional regulator with XRE-family HTH domain